MNQFMHFIRIQINFLKDIFLILQQKISKIFKRKDIITLIQNDLKIETVTIQKMKELTGHIDAGYYNIVTNTIIISDSYSHPNMAESVFVHELIHFFDYNNIKNISSNDVNLVNDKIKYFVSFSIDPVLFSIIYNIVIKFNMFDVPKKFTQELRSRGFSGKYLLYNLVEDFRAYEGQKYYNSFRSLIY